ATPGLVRVDGEALRLAAELHSPTGLNMGAGVSVLGRLSRMARKSALFPDPVAKRVADGLFRIDDLLQRTIGVGLGDAPTARMIGDARRLWGQVALEGEIVGQNFRRRVEDFIRRYAPNDPPRQARLAAWVIARI